MYCANSITVSSSSPHFIYSVIMPINQRSGRFTVFFTKKLPWVAFGSKPNDLADFKAIY